MYLRVRRLVASVVFKTPPLDYEALQALAVLSMFTPTIQTAMPIDSWMVSGIAMNHGTLSFGLSGSDFNVSQETQAQLRRLRIWNALCLTNVQFSIGNGRPNMVQPKFIDQCARIIEFEDALLTDGKLYAEVLLFTRTESILSSGASIQLQQSGMFVVPELEDFRVRWGHLFNIPEGLSLKVGYWYCHLLVYRAALKGEPTDADSAALVSEAIKSSCDILELFLSLEFSIILDMPDHFFFMIIYAALTLCKFAFGHRLIAATQQSLMDLASNDEHIAYRFGIVLVEIRRKAAVAGIEDPATNGTAPTPGINEAVPDVAVLLAGNGDANWDAFLAWNNMPDLSLAQGLEEPMPYETAGYQPNFNPGE
ncbi:putative c6 finger domain protein [Phaeoacremonium minimum UCRPA7]|uniref:Putative c6 finger domain protein n=1 Tax=Phaeoacremonium minimum (strain UCR-PA7) TaxID=1286976 RepID=R8BV47_PHAM7|nr:putative c6 finger domain protein [Phaeoacremonium minimum UCRPA7]EOO03174.1 putative c6 finger domain protein [Phaeoacremonium minimum UCRPA7]